MVRPTEALIRILDALPIALFYIDGDGHLIHQNVTAARFAGRRLVRAAVDRLTKTSAAESALPNQQRLEPLDDSHALHVQSIPPGLLGDVRTLVAVVERASQRPKHLSVADLVATHRLTNQQARVAVALATGLSNREIAERLSLSPHTVRRHTEAVMFKLDVASRAEIAHRLLSESDR